METTERTVRADGSFTEVTTTTPCSVEVTRSAKGLYQWSIKLYADPETMIQAANEIKRVDALLRTQYAGELGQ